MGGEENVVSTGISEGHEKEEEGHVTTGKVGDKRIEAVLMTGQLAHAPSRSLTALLSGWSFKALAL